MKNKKVMALFLAAAMTVGSSMVVLADDATGATSTGTAFDHVNKEVIDVTLPTDAAVATVFNYYVDPERVIDSAGQLTDTTAVTANADGVYFKNAGTAAVQGTISSSIAADTSNDYIVTVSDLTVNETYKYVAASSEWQDSSNTATTVTITIKESDGTTNVTPADGDTVTVSGAVPAGTGSYSSSSDAVKFIGQNSVDVNVTVSAAVTATDAAKDIALVASSDALAAATSPALLMTLKVGNDEKVITSDGATAKATIAGVADNFEITVDGGAYKYGPKASVTPTDASWKSTTVQLVGKTNQKDVPTGANAMTVPKIQLTWTVTKVDETAYGEWDGNTLWLGKDSSTGFSASGLTVEVSDGGTTYKTLATDKYTVGSDGWVSVEWDNIVAGIGSEPTNACVRVTDGTTKYVFEAQ